MNEVSTIQYALAAIEFLTGLVLFAFWRMHDKLDKRMDDADERSEKTRDKLDKVEDEMIRSYMPVDKLEKTFTRLFDLIDSFRKEVRDEFKERDRKGGKSND